MSDMGELWRAVKDERQRLRRLYGKACPKCVELLPRANPTILLPGQRCKIHKYRDPRPRTKENSLFHEKEEA